MWTPPVAQSIGYFRQKVIGMGEHSLHWADTIIASDNDRALRRLQGLLSLKDNYTKEQIILPRIMICAI